jgi:hypothetical protein
LALLLMWPAFAVALQAGEPPVTYRRNPALYRDDAGKIRPVESVSDWNRRRADTRQRIQQVAGPLPDVARFPDPELRVLFDEVLEDGVRRQLIEYFADSRTSPRVKAWLLSPTPVSALADDPFERHSRAAILCPHQTNRQTGKNEPAGFSGDPNMFYALELARRGFVTLAPDFTGSGEHPGLATYSNDYVSATMKGVADHIQAVNILVALPAVDPKRIGCCGHSLGGFNTMMVSVFEPRIKAVVSSCGYVNWQAYADREGSLYLMAGGNYMPLIQRTYKGNPDLVPFDWHEVVAALAPRPLFVNAPLRDDPFLVEGVCETLEAARPIYALLGATNAIETAHPDGGHGFPPEVREQAYRFLERHLAGDARVGGGPDATAVAVAVRGRLARPFAGDSGTPRRRVEAALAGYTDLLKDPARTPETMRMARRELETALTQFELARLPHLRLPAGGWRFRTDPDDAGRDARWFAPEHDDGAWRTDVPIEQGWQDRLDTPYLGVAWYRCAFAAPPLADRGVSVWITFYGVDEEAWVWLNGVYVGGQAVGLSGFDRPFQLDVTAAIRSGAVNRLAVRVRNSVGQGGIWKPVVVSVRETD